MKPVDSTPGKPHGEYSKAGHKCTEIHKRAKLPLMTRAVRKALTVPVDEYAESLGCDYIESCMEAMRSLAGRERSRFPEDDLL